MNKERFEIELLSKSYRNSKRILKEVETQLFHLDRLRINDHQRIVLHIENVIASLDERESGSSSKRRSWKERQGTGIWNTSRCRPITVSDGRPTVNFCVVCSFKRKYNCL